MSLTIEELRQIESALVESEAHDKFGFTYCAYCGERFVVDAPDSTEAVGAHIETCEKHPLRTAEAEIERLRGLLAGVVRDLPAAGKDNDDVFAVWNRLYKHCEWLHPENKG
jgi:hypothetical protein